MSRTRLILITLFAVAACGQARSQDLVEQSLRIPMSEAGKNGLEAVMIRPNDSAAHPLVLINHGTPREADQRPGMTAWGLTPQAREFARRGWTAVMVMRRGFGTSGGGFSEDAQACSSHPDYYDSGKESAKDLRAAIAYLSKLPEVDASRIISVGVSAGGFATVALTADPPPGLVAAISFAGGRGSRKPDEVCNPRRFGPSLLRLRKEIAYPHAVGVLGERPFLRTADRRAVLPGVYAVRWKSVFYSRRPFSQGWPRTFLSRRNSHMDAHGG
jgi:dienelactone hydrolase